MLTGIDAAIAALYKSKDEFIVNFSVSVKRVIEHVHQGVIGRHPVWSGESIAAWHWGIDNTGVSTSGALVRKYSKADRQRFGHTGSIAIGAEPMRASATAGVDSEFTALMIDPKDPFHKYILANDHIRTEMLEYGELPTSERSRSPGGMIRITEAEVAAMIGVLI